MTVNFNKILSIIFNFIFRKNFNFYTTYIVIHNDIMNINSHKSIV